MKKKEPAPTRLFHLVRSSRYLDPEQKLWRIVLLQALIDARGVTSVYKKSNRRFIKDEALKFFNSSYFNQVCYFAGVEPERVKTAFEHLNLEDVARVLKVMD